MNYVIVFKPAAEKDLKRIPVYNSRKILNEIDDLTAMVEVEHEKPIP